MNPHIDDEAKSLPQNQRSSRIIMLVDRVDSSRRLVRKLLCYETSSDYEFIELESGHEALRQLENSTVDCVIFDQYLEDIPTIEFLKELAKWPEEHRPPVVVVASGNDLESAVTALQSGAEDFLIKEKATSQTVQRAVNNAIEKVTLRRELYAQQAALQEELTRRKRVEELLGTQMRVLKSVALGQKRSEVLELITTEVEACVHGSISSILLVTKDGKRLTRGSRNRLPENFNKVVEGVEISPRAGSCGAAAHLKRRVVADNIATAPYWEDYADLALSCNLHACWSTPILTPSGEMMGALAVYFHEPRSPVPSELETLDMAAYLAGIAIERQNHDELIGESRDTLQLALRGGSLGVWEWHRGKDLIQLDAKVLSFLGLRNSTEPISLSRLMKSVHPDDVDLIFDNVRTASTNGSLYEATIRIINPNGSLKGYLRTMGDFQFDETGKLSRIIGVAQDVTIETKAAERLQQSEQHLRDVTDNLLSMIAVLSPDGTVQWINQTAARIGKISSDDFYGLHFADGPPWGNDPDARKRIFDGIKRVNSGELVRYDTVAVVEGQAFDIDFMMAPLYDQEGNISHIVASGLDISERKRAERRLRDNEEFAQRILQSSPDCVLILDLGGRVLEINKPAREMLEVDHLKRVKHKIWRDMWPPESRKALQVALDKATCGTISRFEGFCPTFKGTPKWFDVMLAPVVGPDGQVSRVIASSRDISSAKNLEAQRESILQAEHATRLELEKTNRAKDEFLATLSHELRTPLTSIIGWIEILRKDSRIDANMRDKGLGVIERNARAQHQLIEDILDVSRIIAGQLKIKSTNVMLTPLVEMAVDTLRPIAEEKHIELVSDIQPVPFVLGDSTRLQQLVWNLLSNAIKFTPEGGTIHLTLRQVGQQANLEIKDNGIGIPPSFMPHIFDRFRQADSSSTRQFAGLGLGLAIVKHLVDLHGGTISAYSEGDDKGATFTVQFPLHIEEAKFIPTRHSTGPESSLNELEGSKLLVVDDEPDVLYLVRRLLEKHGAYVETAAGASEAMERLNTFAPDVLISDIGMPGTDGYMLIKQLRERYPQGELPFPALALTAYSSEQDRTQILSAGFAAHLTKPLHSTLIIQGVQGLLDKSRLKNTLN
jgi:PAS domain S-box-containing protein